MQFENEKTFPFSEKEVWYNFLLCFISFQVKWGFWLLEKL